jgi:hypothetical protein
MFYSMIEIKAEIFDIKKALKKDSGLPLQYCLV